jgi:hypothetical protein
MKPRIVTILTGTLTLGLGYWLSENSRDAREIWISIGCWLLGFWFASSILAPLTSATAPDPLDDDDEEYEEE